MRHMIGEAYEAFKRAKTAFTSGKLSTVFGTLAYGGPPQARPRSIQASLTEAQTAMDRVTSPRTPPAV